MWLAINANLTEKKSLSPIFTYVLASQECQAVFLYCPLVL